MTDAELINAIEGQRALMIAVATGGPRIQEVNVEYTHRRAEVDEELQRRGLEDPNPHGDLWAWYGRWSRATCLTGHQDAFTSLTCIKV